MKRMFAVVLAVMLLHAGPAAAEQVFFLVRHAERADTVASSAPPSASAPGEQAHTMMNGDDPPLSAAGEQRAARLAAMLAASGVEQIFTSEFKRTRQTAAPLAARLKLTPVTTAAKDPKPLVEQLLRARAPVLVVGHSNTLPNLLKTLGVADAVTIGENDYDDLFVVVRTAAGTSTLVRLKY